MNGGVIACRIGRRPRATCDFCTRSSVALCDHTVSATKTCDKRICPQHRRRVGVNVDRCPLHVSVEARQERLTL
jgi:hypothetical protein